ncbi:terpene synthase family protein [Embleya sp. AB8]|uniref:terpene synthase family protein n=1 Tax=Embleya sp. AB8 TaxID=3156304 RepID=UPI003C78C71F
MSGLELPLLEYPFGWQVSPLADEVDEGSYRWGLERGIYCLGDPGEYRGTRVGWLAAWTAPDATPAGLRLLADWQMWLFAFDDGFCDESEHGACPSTMIRRVVDFLGVLEAGPDDFRTGHATDTNTDTNTDTDTDTNTDTDTDTDRDTDADTEAPLAQPPPAGAESRRDVEARFRGVLGELGVRVRERATGFQQARFLAAVQGYFMSQCWEAANRSAAGAGGAPPSPAEYVRMRRHSGAVRTCIALTDVAAGFELSADDYDDPEVVALTDMAVDVACWANDIMSYPKEVARSSVVHSLPAVLGSWRDLDPQEALWVAARMHDDQVERYLAAERPVRARASEPLRRYLDGLRFWMSGNLAWSLETGRYPRDGVLEGRGHG